MKIKNGGLRTLCFSLALLLAMSVYPVNAIALKAVDFSDIDAGHWAYESIDLVLSKGYFKGTGPTIFAPEDTMTRAMFITVLSRYAKVKVNIGAKTQFTDVEIGRYYTGPVAWGVQREMIYGMSETIFGPHEPVSREDLVVMVVRMAEFYGKELPMDNEWIDFADEEDICEYAQSNVRTAVQAGIITGYADGTLRPHQSSTRAEVAVVISRIINLIGEVDDALTPGADASVNESDDQDVALEESIVPLTPIPTVLDESSGSRSSGSVPKNIGDVSINGFVAPVSGASPIGVGDLSKTGADIANYSLTSLTWAPKDAPFGYSTVYTATVELTANAGYVLTAHTPTVDRGTASPGTVSANTAGNILTFTVEFPATAAKPVDTTKLQRLVDEVDSYYYAGNGFADVGYEDLYEYLVSLGVDNNGKPLIEKALDTAYDEAKSIIASATTEGEVENAYNTLNVAYQAFVRAVEDFRAG